MGGTHRDVVRLRGLRVDCIVGVYPHERDTPQPLVVDADMWTDTESAATTERLREAVDYEAIANQIAFLLTSCRFRLIETAAHVIAKTLLAPPAAGERRAAISRLRLCLEKPGALQGKATPSVEIERSQEWVTMGNEIKPFGTVDVIHETKDAGIYRLNVAPGREIPLHVHEVMQEAELVLGDGLLCQDRPISRGTVHRWPKGAPHRYRNFTDVDQSILCVDTPPFIPGDEVVVEGEPASVRPVSAYHMDLSMVGGH